MRTCTLDSLDKFQWLLRLDPLESSPARESPLKNQYSPQHQRSWVRRGIVHGIITYTINPTENETRESYLWARSGSNWVSFGKIRCVSAPRDFNVWRNVICATPDPLSSSSSPFSKSDPVSAVEIVIRAPHLLSTCVANSPTPSFLLVEPRWMRTRLLFELWGPSSDWGIIWRHTTIAAYGRVAAPSKLMFLGFWPI